MNHYDSQNLYAKSFDAMKPQTQNRGLERECGGAFHRGALTSLVKKEGWYVEWGKSCCDIRKNYETLLIQMNRTLFCGRFFDDRMDCILSGEDVVTYVSSLFFVGSLYANAIYISIHICGMMYIEGSDRASSPCLSWQYIYDLLVRCLWVVAQHVST